MSGPFLDGFDQFDFTSEGTTKTVYVRGEGPAIVLMHELPGMVPECVQLAHRLVTRGYRVYMPLFFGEPNTMKIVRYTAQVCISNEFALFAQGQSSPITTWLRALCRRAHDECGGPGVGTIGMCLTGGFGLALMAEPAVIAPVLSQPSLPIGPGNRQADPGVEPAVLAQVRERLDTEDRQVLGLRFTGDRLCRQPRFDTLSRELGDRFLRFEIDSSRGNAHGIKPWAHSVLTVDYVDRADHPTRQALDQVFEFMDRHLHG